MLRGLCALLVSLAALQSAAIEIPPDSTKWVAVRAGDARVFSNASPPVAREFGGDVLQLTAAIERITGLEMRTNHTPRVFLFAEAKAVAAYVEAVMSDFVSLFRSGYDHTVLLRGDAQGALKRSTYHDLAHHFLEHTMVSAPLWVIEGVADYCSTLSSKSGGAGRPISDHVTVLANQPLMPLATLFTIVPGAKPYDESRRAGLFHAQSWALVHYLAQSDERRAQFTRFLQRVHGGEAADAAFESAFAIPHAQLEKELKQYVRQLTAKDAKYGEPHFDDAPQAEAMPRDAVLYELGRVVAAMREDHAVHAIKFFDAALKLNPDHAGALASAGALHQRAGRMPEAHAAFAHATTLGSDDADVLLTLANAIIDRYTGSTHPPLSEMLAARSLFTKATELRPESAVAWVGVAMTYTVGDDDLAPGFIAARRALQLAPTGTNAADVLQQLTARQQLNDVNAAIKLANGGKLAEALTQLDRILPAITSPRVLKLAREVREDLLKRIRTR